MANTKSSLVQTFLDANAHEIDETLATFAQSAELFSSSKPRFIDKYEDKWVAAHDGAVVAVADTLDNVMAMVNKSGIPPNETMIRRIDREAKTLIM